MKQGRKLAEGAAAEVFAWGDAHILKLFKPVLDNRSQQHEIRMTRLAHAAGAPAPEVVDVVTIDGRTGMVLPRYDGPTLAHEMLEGRIGPEQGGAMMASLHYALHVPGYRAEVPTFRQFAQFNAGRLRRRGIDTALVDKALSVASALPERGVLCHGDLHGLNVILTPQGPRIIDWMSVLDAPRSGRCRTASHDADALCARRRAV
jgi:aminoglycoside phosphotransferase (APT) family kinase protein